MSIVVEDGTGKSDAETYASVTAYRAYLTLRGLTDTDTDTQVEQRLRASSDYMAGFYGPQWKGTRYIFSQALDWPRYNVTLTDLPGGYGGYPYIVAPNTIPADIVTAQIMLTIRVKTDILAPDVEQTPIKEKLDVIEVEYEKGSTSVTIYRDIDMKLYRYLNSDEGAGVSLVRC